MNRKIRPTETDYSPEPNFATAVAGEMQGMCAVDTYHGSELHVWCEGFTPTVKHLVFCAM